MKRDTTYSINIYGYICDMPEFILNGEQSRITFHILPCIKGVDFDDLKGRLMDVTGTPYREFKIRCVIEAPENIMPKKDILELGSLLGVTGRLVYEPDMLVGRDYKKHNAYGIRVDLIQNECQEEIWANLPF